MMPTTTQRNVRRGPSGPGLVAGTVGLAWTATGVILSTVWAAVRMSARGVSVWAHLMAGREGEDTVVVLRRRKWLVAAGLSCPIVLAGLVAPGPVLSRVGVWPWLSAVVVLAVSVLAVRRLSRRAVRPNVHANVQGVSSDSVWPVGVPSFQVTALADLLYVASPHVPAGVLADRLGSCSAMSRKIVLEAAAGMLAQLGDDERVSRWRGDRLSEDRDAAVPWLYDFVSELGAVAGGARVPADRASQ